MESGKCIGACYRGLITDLWLHGLPFRSALKQAPGKTTTTTERLITEIGIVWLSLRSQNSRKSDNLGLQFNTCCGAMLIVIKMRGGLGKSRRKHPRKTDSSHDIGFWRWTADREGGGRSPLLDSLLHLALLALLVTIPYQVFVMFPHNR